MAQRELQRMSQQDFLAWQAKQDKLYELVDGAAVQPLKMMTGTTRRHDRIVINAIGLLLDQLRGGPCRPWTDAVAISIPQGNVRRPDVSVDCGELSDRELVAATPKLVIEVLSPSTMSFDRIVKLGEYKRVATLETILLVDTEEPQITVYQRKHGQWVESLVKGLDAIIRPAGIEAEILLQTLYDGVSFTQG